MGENSPNTVAAEVSIYSSGLLFIGVEARRALGIGLDDTVRVEIPEIGRVVEGSLNSSNTVYVGTSLFNAVAPIESPKPTQHVEALVQDAGGSWDDNHGLTEERHEGTNSLKAKVMAKFR